MIRIEVNDVFDEFSEENKRLLNELMFANKCLNVLITFKTFVDFISNKIKSNLDSNESKKFEELSEEVKQVLTQKSNPKKLNQNRYKIISRHSSTAISDKREDNTKRVERLTTKPNVIKIRIIEKSDKTSDLKKTVNTYSKVSTFKRPLFLCNFIDCEKRFFSKNGLKDHQICHQYVNQSDGTDKTSTIREDMKEMSSSCGKSSEQPLVSQINICDKNRERLSICEFDGCYKQFLNQRLLWIHQRNVHSQGRAFGYVCPYCGKIFTNNGSLKQHLTIHSTVRPFICTEEGCERKFKTSSQLRVHIMGVHTSGSFSCSYEGCHKQFKLQKYLDYHKKTSHSSIEHYCHWPECQFKTRHLNSLSTHQLTHSDVRNYACDWPQCGKRFKSKYQLKLHQLYHKDYKPHGCDWPGCDYRSVTSSNLNAHMKSHQKT